MWVGAPLMTYNTLRGVSDQWEMAQDGVSLATVTKMVEKHSQDREGVTDNITSYGQYAFYSQMEETFSVGARNFMTYCHLVVRIKTGRNIISKGSRIQRSLR